jgi:hypothetical protein
MSERIVRIASQMYECRRACRSLFGDRYAASVDPYGAVIKRVAAVRKLDIIPAAVAMANEMKAVDSDPMITICLMAAAVDLVEPKQDNGPAPHNGE